MIPFDFILAGILLVSAVLGYLQGALKELISLVSLVLALALAILGFRHMEPMVDSWINPDWAAPPLTFLLLFAGAYLGLRLAGAGLAGGLRQARLLNALDRAMGFAFGLIRATLFLGVCNLAFTAASPAGYAPSWLAGSLFYPLTARSADLIRAMAAVVGNRSGLHVEEAPERLSLHEAFARYAQIDLGAAIVESGEIIEPLRERIVGRVTLERVADPFTGEVIADPAFLATFTLVRPDA